MLPLEICRHGPGPLWSIRKYAPVYSHTQECSHVYGLQFAQSYTVGRIPRQLAKLDKL
jgi:hypothetical protein